MQRFLVCMVLHGYETGNPLPSWKVFPVKPESTIKEVSTPRETIWCFFTTNESVEKVYNQLFVIKDYDFPFASSFTTTIPKELKHNHFYLFGKIVWMGKNPFIYNGKISILYPLSQFANIRSTIAEP